MKAEYIAAIIITYVLFYADFLFGCNYHTKYLLDANYTIKHCQSNSKGYFHIQRYNQSKIISPKGLILYGRIIGPVIFELVFHRHHRTSLEAIYKLPNSGIYNASIELRYEHFDPNNYSSSTVYYDDNELLNVTIVCTKGELIAAGRKHNNWNFKHHALHNYYWRSPIPVSMPSKMSFIDESHTELMAIQSSRIQALNNSLTFDDLDVHDIMKRIAKSSIVSQQICFVGDSQMRHLHKMFIEILFGRQDNNFHINGTKTDKSVSPSESLHHIVDHWTLMNFSASETQYLDKCSTIFLNFGQWHVGWSTQPSLGRGPFKLTEYEDLVNRTLHAYMSRIKSSTKLYYLGTLNFGNSRRSYTPGRNDFRDDAVLRAINDGGMRVCDTFQGVKCLNVYEISNVVRDLSYDTYHFYEPVGTQMALAIINVMLDAEIDLAHTPDKVIKTSSEKNRTKWSHHAASGKKQLNLNQSNKTDS